MASKPRPPLLSRQSTILTGSVLKQLQEKHDVLSEAIDFCYKLCHIWSERHPERAAEVYNPNIKLISSGYTIVGIENILKVVNSFHDSMENINYEIEDVYLQGNLENGKVCYIVKFSGDWVNPFGDAPPTNSRESYMMTITVIVKNKKAEEMRLLNDYSSTPAFYNAIVARRNKLQQK